eukprot:1871-Prorocentrum_minimum.AAC.1
MAQGSGHWEWWRVRGRVAGAEPQRIPNEVNSTHVLTVEDVGCGRGSDPPPDPLPTPSRPPPASRVLRTGLGLVRGTSTLHTELAPGNPGCSQRWEHRVLDVCAPR